MSLPWWSFDAGVSSITTVADSNDILTAEQIQMWNSTQNVFNPIAVGSRQGCGLCFLLFSISIWVSESATLRSVCCYSTTKQNYRSMKWLMSHMPFSEGEERGKNKWQVSKCAHKSTAREMGNFNSIISVTLALTILGTALKCSPPCKQDIILKLRFRLKLQSQ